MPYCPECGASVGATDRFCPKCGTSLGQTTGSEKRRTGRGDPDRSVDHGQRRQPSGTDESQSRWGNTGEQSGWGSAERQSRWGSTGGQSGWDSREGQSSQRTGGGQPPQQADRGRQPPAADDRGLLSFSLSYPASGGADGLILGSLALMFAWLVLPIFLVAGYFVRMAAAAAAGRPESPGFDDATGLLKDGAVLVFGSLPVWLSYGVLAVLALDVSGSLYVALVLVGSYLFPAIFVNYAVERRWQALYDVSALTDLVTTRQYLVGYLGYVLLINGVGAIVLLFLLIGTALTVVGLLLWPVIFFYWYAISVALWGKVYRQAMGPATIPDPPTYSQQQQPRPQQQQRY
jgi:hypothetical protein